METMRTFWIVSGLLFVWALIGDMAYLAQVTADLDELAKTDPISASAFRTMPEWVWTAYAVAVWVGTLGAIALLLRRKWAVPLYAVSLIAVILQFGWTFLATQLIEAKGADVLIFPAVIIAVGAFSLWWAMKHAKSGVLK
nr:sugar transporter [Croceicoccus sp. Ery15]